MTQYPQNPQPPQGYPQQQPAQGPGTTPPQQGGDPWSNPTGGSDLFSPSNHVGAVILFAVRAFHPQMQGSFGARDAVECGVDIVSEPRNPASTGQRFDTALVYGVALVDEMRDKVGTYVLGRLMSKPSKNPQPVIVLEPCSDYEQDQARAHVNRYGLPSLQAKPAGEVAQANANHAQAFTQQYGQQQAPQQPFGGPPAGPPVGPPPPSQQPAQVGQPAPWGQPGQTDQPPF